jgi:hypothetical protein
MYKEVKSINTKVLFNVLVIKPTFIVYDVQSCETIHLHFAIPHHSIILLPYVLRYVFFSKEKYINFY